MDLSKIYFYTIDELQRKLTLCPFKKPIILINRQKSELWELTDTLMHLVGDNRAIWFDHIDPFPNQESLWRILKLLDPYPDADGLIAIGGGSVIDTAKILSAFRGMHFSGSEAVINAINQKTYQDNRVNALPIIAVPTTAGTGSEVTQWATVWENHSTRKHSVEAQYLLPSEAWIIPELTYTMSPRLTLSTGLDAVCHACEAFWAKSSTPLVKELSLRSLQIATEDLLVVLINPDNRTSRKNMSISSLLAGLAFSQTKTTACHSISYPLTATYHIEHGFACALTLAPVARYNSTITDLTKLFEVFAPYNGIQSWLDNVCREVVTLRLSHFGIHKDAIHDIANNAFTSGRMDNNPVDLSRQDVIAILEEVL